MIWGAFWTWIARKILPFGADKSAQVMLGLILATAILVLLARCRGPKVIATPEQTFYPQQRLLVYFDGKEISVDVGQCSPRQAAQRVADAINAAPLNGPRTADVVTLSAKHRGGVP